MSNSHLPGWFTGRTRIITIVSLLAVGAAGALAVSANIGIIDAAPDSNVGSATAQDLTTPSSQVVDVYLPQQSTSTTAASTGAQEFAVDTAGTVTVAANAGGLHLDSVAPAAGWSWSLSQTGSSQLMVTLTDGTRTLEFVATLNADGTIGAAVNEPIVTATPSNGGGYEDDDEGDDDDHEGGEDDD